MLLINLVNFLFSKMQAERKPKFVKSQILFLECKLFFFQKKEETKKTI